MADIEASRLSIVIDVKGAEKAEQEIKSLSDTFKKMPAAVEKSGTTQALRSVQKESQKASGKLKQLFSSMKRIATYRLLRTVLKEIGQAFKEGINNLVLYSAAMNSMDAARANATMSEYASTLLYVKNSIGAAAMPMLQSLLPAIQTLAHWFVVGTNAVNQFWSALQGKSVFTRAKEYAVDYSDSLKSATGHAKELKKTIASFDEINLLNGNTGGSGGGGASNLDYSQMFEEAEIESKFQKIAEKVEPFITWVKENFEDIKNAAGIIMATIAAWKVSSSIQKLFNILGGGLGQTAAYLTGLTLLITGARISMKSGYSAGLAGREMLSDIKDWLGIALAAVGGGIAGAAIGGVGGAAIGIVFGFTVGLILQGIGFNKGVKERLTNEFNNSSLGRELKEIVDRATANIEVGLSIKAKLNDITGEIDATTLGKLQFAKSLIAEIFSFDQKQNKTSGEIDILKSKIQTLNGLGLPGIELHFDTLTEKVVESRANVESLIAALERQYKMEALEKAAVAAYEQRIEAERILKITQEDLTTAQGHYFDAVKKQQALETQRANFIGSKLSPEYRNLREEVAKAKIETDAAKEALDKATAAHRINQEALDESKEKIKYFADQMSEMALGADTAKKSISDLSRSTIKDMNDARKSVDDLGRSLKNIGGSGGKIVVSYNVGKFASGGFPEDGLFFANHNELVGRFSNGRTAVANNDQIVAGITSGVREGTEDLLPMIDRVADRIVEAINRKQTNVTIDSRDIKRGLARNSLATGGIA